MSKKGFTIVELLVSIAIISIVILLLLRVMISLEKINNDTSYASSDELQRGEVIKNIESDFLEYKLKNIEIKENDNKTNITFIYEDNSKELVIYKDKLIYEDTVYKLKSSNAIYSLKPNYEYIELDNNYYLIKLDIPVLIDNKNTTINDDITLVYLNK